jgi:putative ABC transport system permease protein
MGMIKLAMQNFRNGFKNYLSLVISLAFTVLVLFNFQNIIYSHGFEVLGTRNKEYVEMLVQIISFVLGCFMFFFIWYSTNVFLTRRKKEIGIYVFMGLSNDKIGKMYLIESALTGLSALLLGLGLGALSGGLFQMILLAVSDIAVEIQFRPSIGPVMITAAVYLAIYLFFAGKGYVSIVRSSVLNLISAARQNEYVRQKRGILAVKSAAGGAVLGAGYFLAIKPAHGGDAMANSLGAVILVTAGVYLLFGGLIPLIFQTLSGHKSFLYRNQRVLWVNSMIFRMKKNYRTYAMVCVLMLCSVTALATGFAMKGRYDTIIRFENTYTFQLLSNYGDLEEETEAVINESGEIRAKSSIPILYLDSSTINSKDYSSRYALVPFSRLHEQAGAMNLDIGFQEPKDDEVVKISHPYLMSLITDRSHVTVEIAGKTYSEIMDTSVPYLGYLQESISFYLVNDKEYERLRPMGTEWYTYNYKIKEPEQFAATKARLDEWVSTQEEGTTARVAIDPKSNELDWVKVLYSICIFMFLVFVLASGSIMYMKLYNDAFEEKAWYQVILNMGFEKETLRQSVKAELAAAYGLPFAVMAVSSFFSVKALGNMMFTDLSWVNGISVGVVLVILLLWYALSVRAYGRNAGI